ncbi:Gfo/Idh/MocA family oxidoreductase [Mesorhizobium sp. BR1-1-9]|uniref:Gfo/Idh/MocA family protein n=1 Tax=unclassified Mesorhizobium TaxID=325217 RepID=UPI001CD05D27|nr:MULTISPECIES: Gfo/Idh/MocA family oxidoreductase [unclassified Mesorhizobium]MBZ9873190.1 Gfo/Idh/MocA family oxidoreductase [Mesorhizobium sp. BR1-1-9]MBZ9944999.1 Gfo/Idh/MocA family oxidoreductase [Mesorhizobium sp. BR1-1-13]
MKELNVGILGAGFIGTFHSYALRLQQLIKEAPKANLNLSIVADRDQKARDTLVKRFGWEKGVDDWRAVLDANIDIFVNAGPNVLHAEPSIAALKAGKAVFCEKPLAMDAAEAFEMWKAAAEAKAVHQAAFVYRFVPALRYARELIQSGAIGEVTHFRSEYLMSNYLQPGLDFSWRLDKKIAGTGTFGDLGAHHIDLARFLVGEISEVASIGRTVVPQVAGKKVEVDDAFVSILQFESGPIGVIQASRVAAGHGHTSAIQVDGTKGSLRYDVARLNELEIAEGLASGFRTVQVIKEEHPFSDFWWEGGVQGSHPIGWVECFVQQMNHFVEAVLGNRQVSPLAATFEDGYRAVEIADSMIRSWQSARREPIIFRSL